MDNPNNKQNITGQADYAPLPELAGYRFYRFTGSDEDYENIVDIVNSRHAEADFHAQTTVEETRHDYQYHGASCKNERDILFAEKDGQVVAYCRISQDKEKDKPYYKYFSMLYVRPGFWADGLPETLLAWCESQAVARHKAHHDGAKGEHRYHCLEKMDYKVDFITRAGYQPIRYWDTKIHTLEHIPHYALPEGFDLRPVMPSQYRAIWDANNEAFQDHWDINDMSEDDYQAWLKDKDYFQPHLFQVAWDGDEIAAMVLPWVNGLENESKNRARAWLGDISVRLPWRGKGLAKALISRSLEMLKLMNLKEVALVVDTENPNGATKLYDTMGFVTEERGISWMKPLIE